MYFKMKSNRRIQQLNKVSEKMLSAFSVFFKEDSKFKDMSFINEGMKFRL